MTIASIAAWTWVAATWPDVARAQDMVFTEEDVEAAEQGQQQGDTSGGDVIGELTQGGTAATGAAEAPTGPITETREEIYAVQQIYALRINRVELAPSAGFTVNDPYVSHPAAALGLNYWWTNVLAVGVNFLWYQGLENESDLGFHVRRSTRLAVPITEYQLGAHLNFTYVPLYGKFAMFNEYIFQWDAYVVGGVGMMRTRPVPIVDPQVRRFEFDWRIAFNAGLGLRIFLTRFLAVFAELRDYAYLERLENLEVALGEDRNDPETWLAESPSLTNNVTAHVGITLFVPFRFEYRLPK
ncbi:MAG: outer membrane beta-barrel domain-containing protein [Myxococcota bacterium]|nr:outer membrane beta-barrel domain-containing protein [Myxococcota bacterium]MDW8361396.1 outer membrane beta-barrel domain-containing protein [Myxococcales bacterium]